MGNKQVSGASENEFPEREQRRTLPPSSRPPTKQEAPPVSPPATANEDVTSYSSAPLNQTDDAVKIDRIDDDTDRPWLIDVFGEKLLVEGTLQSSQILLRRKKHVAILCGATWNPTTGCLIPPLIDMYEKLQKEHADFIEVVILPYEKDQETYDTFIKGLPASWPAVPFESVTTKEIILSKYEIDGIPALVVLDGVNGTVKDTKGRRTVVDSVGSVKGYMRAYEMN